MRYTGKPVPLQVTTLTNKTALNPPERKVLNPAEQQAEEARKAAEEKARQEQQKKKENGKKQDQTQATSATPADTFDVEALEITDMPGSYELNFDDGLRIFIRSKSGFSEKFRQTRETLLWYTWYPVKHFLNRKSGCARSSFSILTTCAMPRASTGPSSTASRASSGSHKPL